VEDGKEPVYIKNGEIQPQSKLKDSNLKDLPSLTDLNIDNNNSDISKAISSPVVTTQNNTETILQFSPKESSLMKMDTITSEISNYKNETSENIPETEISQSLISQVNSTEITGNEKSQLPPIKSAEIKGTEKPKTSAFKSGDKKKTVTINLEKNVIQGPSEDKANPISPENKNNDTKEPKKTSIMNKIKMFSDPDANQPPEIKSKKTVDVKKVKIMEPTPVKKISSSTDKDKEKEQRMNKALARIKKKREKSEGSESAKHDPNDVRFKSIRIKNMADLLEGQLNKANKSFGPNKDMMNPILESKKEENPIKDENEEMMDKIFEMNQRKTIVKRKMTKKKFEE
jgi:hypothetical protein